MNTPMKYAMLILLIAFLCGMTSAQTTVQAGIFNPGEDTLVVKAKPDNALSGLFSNVVVTIKWLSTYGITLSAPVSSSGITAQGSVGTQGDSSYQIFGGTPNTIILWPAGSENELFRVRVSGGTGTGTFVLTNSVIGGEWYFELNGSDVTNPSFYAASAGATPLPIQLATFAATIGLGNHVVLRWTTLSEKDNYGFEVQRSLEVTQGFQTIPGSFVKGNGTTVRQHAYSYTMPGSDQKSWYYRLKQIDLDGSVNYSEAIQAGPAGKPVPKEFALDQNYPNPFNPTTTISFAVPKDGDVTVEVFNVLGQRVASLAEGFHEAGYYTVPFDARELSSGVYFYRMVTKETTFLKKMMVLK